MASRHLFSSAAAVALALHAGAVVAQDRAPSDTRPASETPQTPTVVIENRNAPAAPAYASPDPIDSGTSVLGEESVDTRAPGSGDVNAILRILPTVQFSGLRGQATRSALQDLRPETISISGGSVNENLFVLDGVGVNSYIYDADPTTPADFSEVAGASAQTHWVDASLVGQIIVRDSNVSAEYGQFTGGVVEIATRSPRPVYGFETYYGLTDESMASYRISDRSRASLGTAVLPDSPTFKKERYGFSADLPVNDRLSLLAGYNRSTAVVTNYPIASYANVGSWGQRSSNENFLLKAEYDLADDLKLTGQINYSPYESEFRGTNSVDNLIVSNGGGLTVRAGLEGSRGDATWNLDLSYAGTNNDRDAPWGSFAISTSAPGMSGCSLGTSCTIGAGGDLTQDQKQFTLKGLWEQPLGVGDLRLGFDISRVEARRVRERDLVSHLTSDVSTATVCLKDEGLSCVTGSYALTSQLRYSAFDARADIDAYSLWGEYRFDLSGFDIRAGLRYDYESFLENHNVAPRLSVSRDLPWAGMNLTAGANRYYGRSFVGYALREGSGVTRRYTRSPIISNGQRQWTDNWVQTLHLDSNRYSGQGLDTPYSDELTLALRGPIAWLGGQYSVRGILRESRDQFARSARGTETFVNELGATATRSLYTMTNDGERSYRGLSLEYSRSIGPDHSLTFSTNVSHTDATNLSYFDMSDETELSGVLVYYKGEVVDVLQALADNQLGNFAAPLILNGDWNAKWWGGRIRSNVNVRYREGFSRVDDTGVNIRVNNVTYDVYDKVNIPASTDVNLSLTADVARTIWGDILLDVRVNNLFDTVLNDDYLSTSQPYQLGRNAWVSVKFRY
jgi:hypothetical protein